MRVAITGGAGGVGSALAYTLVTRPEPFDVVLIDRGLERVTSHVMDLELLLEAGGVRAGSCPDVTDGDVLVICASASPTRAADNAPIIDEIAGRLSGWDGAVLVVTNPVDALTARLARTLGDRRRVLGYTLNDTLRLRAALPGGKDVWVLGEHGDAAVPIFSRVHPPVDEARRTDARAFVRGWYRRHVALDAGRSSTWTSATGIARMLAAMARDDGEQWVASVLLDGEYGLRDVATGVPVTIGPRGLVAIQEWELAPDELAALQTSPR
ncbi:hypothetical protein OJ997_18660 [Solirubrobacter phytolaccae]|uniref:Lactate dehydrogenase n=1 Tax=Solirubrobacter phytolaccae TaxID=1404360 RepID=A0A9X3NE07_9ACTN|nr:hypothetical protein [Solirubrobacter phytolaccae]MDA0182336.1 hypothetical protein [Solirubrobacter phytolaccae]